MKNKKININFEQNRKSLGAVHTHTHTHTDSFKRKEVMINVIA